MNQNTKNIIISVLVVVLMLGATILFVRSKNDKKSRNQNDSALNAQQPFSVEESSYDFGTISMAAGNASHTFKLKNSGAQKIKINKIYTSCMCTNASLINGNKKFGPYGMPGHSFVPAVNESVEPGAEINIEVVFDPTAHGPAGVGPVDRVVYIETSAGVSELGIKAVVRP